MTEQAGQAQPAAATTASAGECPVRYRLQQSIRYGYSATVRDLRQRLVVVPPDRYGTQDRQHWQVGVDGVDGARVVEVPDAFGNVALDVHVPEVREWVSFEVEFEVTVSPADGPAHVQPDRRYQRPTALTASSSAITSLAFGAGREPADLCAAVYEAMTYEWGVTGVHTSAAEALTGGVGVCQDYAHVMIAACRAVGLPARYVSGHLLGEGGSHAWVEVLRRPPGRRSGWAVEAWDPTHDRPARQGYVTVAVGRDYADVAPLSGTFEGEDVRGTLEVTKRVVAL